MQVYQEALCRRHYSSILSAAALFRLVSFVLAVVLSFLLAYATGGFWKKVGHEVVQPTVHYSGDGLLILETSTPGQEQVWTSSSALAAALTSNRLSAAVQVGEEDYNQDGKPEVIRFTATAQSRYPVNSFKMLLQFSYSLQGAVHLRMHGLAYLTAASPQPGSSFSADGELLLRQTMPLPATTVLLGLEKPLLDSATLVDGAAVQGGVLLQLSSVLAAYQARNVTTVFNNQYPVWQGGNSNTFTVDAKIRIPAHQVHMYRPGLSEMLKWGWIQFACTFWILYWLMDLMERLVFGCRILETRVISDMQARTQRY